MLRRWVHALAGPGYFFSMATVLMAMSALALWPQWPSLLLAFMTGVSATAYLFTRGEG